MPGKRLHKLLLGLLVSTSLVSGSIAPAWSDAKGSLQLNRAKKAYLTAKDDWQNKKNRFDAYLKKRHAIDEAYDKGRAEYWDRRQKFERDYARDLRTSRQNRQDYEKAYRTAVKQYEALDAQRDTLYAELTRLRKFISSGTATGIEKIKAKKLEKKVNQLDSKLRNLLEERKTLHTQFNTARQSHDKERAALWKNQPRSSELFDLDETHKTRREDLTRSLTSYDVEEARAQKENAAISYFAEILKNQPPIVTRVQAIGKTGNWYEASWEEDPYATGEGPSALNKRGYQAAIAKIDKEIAKLDELLTDANSTMKGLRREWEHQNYVESYSRSAIADNELKATMIIAGIECGAVLGAFVISGGLAAPAAHGAATAFASLLGQKTAGAAMKVTPEFIAKSQSLIKAGLKSHYVKKSFKLVGKVLGRKGRKVAQKDGLSYLRFVTDMFASKGANFALNDSNYLGDYNGMSSATGIAVGDALEVGLSGGWRDFATAVTGKAASSSALLEAKNLAGFTVVATGSKVAVRLIADIQQDSYEWDAFEAMTAIRTLKTAYFAAASVRNALRVEKSYLTEAKESLQKLHDHGPRRLKKTVTTDRAIIAKDMETIDVHFSTPLDFPPVIKANNIALTGPTPHDGNRKIWRVNMPADRFDEDVKEIKLRISLSTKEKLWNMLDAQPRTPLRLALLDKDSWKGFEKGVDGNHILHLRKEDEEQAELSCPFSTRMVLHDSSGKGGCDVFNPHTNSCLIVDASKDPLARDIVEISQGLCMSEPGKLIVTTDPDTGKRRYYSIVDESLKMMRQLDRLGQELKSKNKGQTNPEALKSFMRSLNKKN